MSSSKTKSTFRQPEAGEPKKKAPRRPTKRRIANQALAHVQKHATTEANLHDVLARRAKRAAAFHEGVDMAEVEVWIQEAVAGLVALGYIKDEAFSDARAARLSRGGKGERVIRQHLKQKGVPEALAEESMRRVEEHAEAPAFGIGAEDALSADAETCRCAAAARKRRIGPFRTSEPKDGDERKESRREMAALGRQGFSYGTIQAVLSMLKEDLEELASRLL